MLSPDPQINKFYLDLTPFRVRKNRKYFLFYNLLFAVAYTKISEGGVGATKRILKFLTLHNATEQNSCCSVKRHFNTAIFKNGHPGLV